MGVRELLLRVKGKDDGASRTLKGVGKAAESAEDDIDGMNRGLAALDNKIADTTKTLTDLRAEIARTGDLDLIKDVTKQEQRLKALTRQRKSLIGAIVPEPEEVAQGFGAAITQGLQRLQSLLPGSSVLGSAAGPLQAAIAAPLAAGVGASVAGAIVGGSAGVGVLGGLAIASRDRRVRAAGAQLGETVMSQLERSATAFVPATLDAIGIIREDLSLIDRDLDKAFSAAARYVRPLTEGLGGLVRNVMPGLRRAIESAGPIIREISQGLPRLGRAAGDLLDTAADNADSGASAVRGLIMATEDLIRGTATAIDWGSSLYRTLVDVGLAAAEVGETLGGWVPISGEQIRKNADRMRELKAAMEEGGEEGASALLALADGFQRIDDEAGAAGQEVETFYARLARVTGENLDARDALRGLEQAFDDAAESTREHGKTLDVGTEKGRANQQALDAIAREALAARDALIATEGTQGQVNQVMADARERFIATARAMGLGRDEADRLARQLGLIPTRVSTKVDADTAPALRNLANYRRELDRIPGSKTTYARLVYESTTARGGVREFSSGGPVTGGIPGRDSVPALLSPGEVVLNPRDVAALGGQRRVEQWRRSLTAAGAAAPTGVAGRATGSARTIAVTVQAGYIATPMQLEAQFVNILDSLRRQGRI